MSIIKSVKILSPLNPDIIFVQNPSMILALFGCIYKKICKKYLIVDRHSNFMITKKYWNPFYKIMFKSLNGLTIKNADLTIVTNSFIANLVKNKGGNALILQDKIPQMQKTKNIKIKGKIKVLFIASHHQDEPLADAIKAINYLNDTDIYLYVTGDYKKVNKIRLDAPKNVVFTGFIDDKKFINLFYAVDIILVLTKNENFLLCGCYSSYCSRKTINNFKYEDFKGIFYISSVC